MREPSRQAFIWSSHQGRHFVRYKDGAVSGLMSKSVAQDYASIFNGTVCCHSTDKTRECSDWDIVDFILLLLVLFITFNYLYNFLRGNYD